MKKKWLLILIGLSSLNSFSEYSIKKIANDKCSTIALEGAVRVYATGNSGPYTIYGPNNSTHTINNGQSSVVIAGLGEGEHNFIVENAYGCQVTLSEVIVKYDCAKCTSSTTDVTLNDYPVAGVYNINNISAANLKILRDNFTSNFTITSDLLQSKICVKNECTSTNTANDSPGSIIYSNVQYLNSRLSSNNTIVKVKLFGAGNVEYSGTQTISGDYAFENLTAGSYTLRVLLIDNSVKSPGTTILTNRVVRVFSKTCGKKGKDNSLAGSRSNQEEDDSQEENVTSINSETLQHQNIELSLTAWPNPVQERLSFIIHSNENIAGEITLLNSLGELVYEKNIDVKSGENSHSITMSTYQAGIYTLSFSETSQHIIPITTRITKTN